MTNQGSTRRNLFLEDKNREGFLELLRKTSQQLLNISRSTFCHACTIGEWWSRLPRRLCRRFLRNQLRRFVSSDSSIKMETTTFSQSIYASVLWPKRALDRTSKEPEPMVAGMKRHPYKQLMKITHAICTLIVAYIIQPKIRLLGLGGIYPGTHKAATCKVVAAQHRSK